MLAEMSNVPAITLVLLPASATTSSMSFPRLSCPRPSSTSAIIAPMATAPNAPPKAPALAVFVAVERISTVSDDIRVADSVNAFVLTLMSASARLPVAPTSAAATPAVNVLGMAAVEFASTRVFVEPTVAPTMLDEISLRI